MQCCFGSNGMEPGANYHEGVSVCVLAEAPGLQTALHLMCEEEW